jgi:hypothetical protein
MKKNYFKILGGLFLTLFISVQSFAQLGTDVYTLGLDNSNNYGGTWNTTSAGTGFGNWTFDESTPSGGFTGRFLGSFSTDLDVSENSFGLFANSGNNATSGASRSFPKILQEGDVFKVSVGVNFRDGAKGFDLRDASNATIVNFNVGSDKYTIAGFDLYTNTYDANTVITFTFTQNATSLNWTAVRSGGLTDTQSGTINSINAGTIANIRLYNVSAGTNNDGGSGQRNLYFNSLEFTSKYTINNDSSVNVTSSTTAPYLQVESGSTVTVASAIALTVSENLTNNGTVTLNSGSSLIVNGTSTGNVIYTRNLPTSNWYLVSSPVSGQAYNDAYVTANGIDSGTGSNRGIATYTTSSNQWAYLQAASDGTFNNGQGYSVKRTATGDISFTGTINTSDVSVAVANTGTGFNLIGNPFTSYLQSDLFLAGNTANLVSQTLWVWNQGTSNYDTYVTVNEFDLAPAQGFFVRSSNGTNLNIAESYQASTGGTFQKSARTEVKLLMNDGTADRFAKLYYLDNVTKGFDNGFDGETFGGIENSVDVFTNLVENNEGKKYQIQSLPIAEMETMIVPVGIKAAAGKEITFTAEALNLPGDTKVFLEDRLTNTVTRLDEANSSYKITLNDALNETGRFYLHTKASGVLSTDELALSNTSVYATANNTLRVVGLPSGNTTVKVFTILGKQVVQTSFSSTGSYDVSLPKLATGMYIVQLETATRKLNKKIVLE